MLSVNRFLYHWSTYLSVLMLLMTSGLVSVTSLQPDTANTSLSGKTTTELITSGGNSSQKQQMVLSETVDVSGYTKTDNETVSGHLDSLSLDQINHQEPHAVQLGCVGALVNRSFQCRQRTDQPSVDKLHFLKDRIGYTDMPNTVQDNEQSTKNKPDMELDRLNSADKPAVINDRFNPARTSDIVVGSFISEVRPSIEKNRFKSTRISDIVKDRLNLTDKPDMNEDRSKSSRTPEIINGELNSVDIFNLSSKAFYSTNASQIAEDKLKSVESPKSATENKSNLTKISNIKDNWLNHKHVSNIIRDRSRPISKDELKLKHFLLNNDINQSNDRKLHLWIRKTRSDLKSATFDPYDHRSEMTTTDRKHSLGQWHKHSKPILVMPQENASFIYSHTTRSRQRLDMPHPLNGFRPMDKSGKLRLTKSIAHRSDAHPNAKWLSEAILAFISPEVNVQGLCHKVRASQFHGQREDATTNASRTALPLHPYPHPASCAWYIDCALRPDAVMLTYFGGNVLECPYPQLFSAVTRQCEDFKDVDCGSRFEPKSPCEYRANRCRESSHCIPCWVRYASCREQVDGLNPWRGMEWHRFFVECHKERTVFQGICHPSAVFSPITRACETPISIPSQHGGWKPGCTGRRDGLYPDHLGRCDLYFLCQGQLFRGFHRCGSGEKFNPYTSRCQKPEQVPLPCGDMEQPGDLCRSKLDGNYLDVFGRCNHYFTCKNRTMVGMSVCSKGIFNVRTGQCDVRPAVRGRLPSPCGKVTNVCLLRKDGVYQGQGQAAMDSVKFKCYRLVECERGMVISSRMTCK